MGLAVVWTVSGQVLGSASKLDLKWVDRLSVLVWHSLVSAVEEDSGTEGGRDSCRGTKAQTMEQMLRQIPLKAVNIPWRNNNLSTLHVDPPLSEQGETFIGIYLLALGKSALITKYKPINGTDDVVLLPFLCWCHMHMFISVKSLITNT